MSEIEFRVVKSIPDGMTRQIEQAVMDFLDSSKLDGINREGFFALTLEGIANATYMNGGGEFWLGTKNGELLIYILAGISNDTDGRLNYSVSQAWVRPDYRGSPIVKEWWEAVRARAKHLFCRHLTITSSRGYKAYERFLGHGMKHHADILKETL